MPSPAPSAPHAAEPARRAPWPLRVAILLLSLATGLLALWLLGFVLQDIGRLPHPDLSDYEAEVVDADLRARLAEQGVELELVQRDIARQEEVQRTLRASIENARGTIGQMLTIRRLALEKELPWTEAEGDALATAQERFLRNQDELEQAIARTAELEARRHALQVGLDADRATFERQRGPAREEYAQALRAREFRVAALKLAVLLPVFVAAAWLVARRRTSLYRTIWFALLAAATWRVFVVIHEHFPAELFNYLALATGLAVVLAFLVRLLRSAARPAGDVLLRRNREGYRRGECPRCAFPLAGGPEDGPASCASCGLALFAECPSCGAVRHSQLPHCHACGAGWPAG